MKILHAKLKEPIHVAVSVNTFWDTDPIGTSRLIESEKKSLVCRLREKMHEKIAMLDADDIDFSISDEWKLPTNPSSSRHRHLKK